MSPSQRWNPVGRAFGKNVVCCGVIGCLYLLYGTGSIIQEHQSKLNRSKIKKQTNKIDKQRFQTTGGLNWWTTDSSTLNNRKFLTQIQLGSHVCIHRVSYCSSYNPVVQTSTPQHSMCRAQRFLLEVCLYIESAVLSLYIKLCFWKLWLLGNQCHFQSNLTPLSMR